MYLSIITRKTDASDLVLTLKDYKLLVLSGYLVNLINLIVNRVN